MVLKTNSDSGSESLTLRVAGSPLLAVAAAFTGPRSTAVGHVVDEEVEYFVGPDVAETGSEQHGKYLVFANGVVQAGDDVLLGNRALVEELFHQRVVAFGDQFDQTLVRGLGFFLHVGRNVADLGFAVAAHFVGVSLHPHQVDDAAETLLRTDGQLHRNHGAPERRGQRFHHAGEVGALAVHARADDGARQGELVAVMPDALGDDFHAADRVHHHQRGLDRRQHHLGFMDEHVEARRVDEVDLGVAPLDHRGRGRNGHRPRDLFVVVIGHGVAFIHAAKPLRGAGGEQHGRCERGLAGV